LGQQLEVACTKNIDSSGLKIAADADTAPSCSSKSLYFANAAFMGNLPVKCVPSNWLIPSADTNLTSGKEHS